MQLQGTLRAMATWNRNAQLSSLVKLKAAESDRAVLISSLTEKQSAVNDLKTPVLSSACQHKMITCQMTAMTVDCNCKNNVTATGTEKSH